MPGNFKFGNKSEQSEKREWKKNYDFFDDENPVFFEWGNKVIKISRDSWSSDKGKGEGVRLQPGYINKKGEWFGRTRTNKNVKIEGIKGGEDLVGQIVKVEITAAQDFGLVGQIKK